MGSARRRNQEGGELSRQAIEKAKRKRRRRRRLKVAVEDLPVARLRENEGERV